MRRWNLIVKGFCMGIADVIPGVSGGTLALILGVYRELVDTIKGLHPRILLLALQWLRRGKTEEDRAALVAEWQRLNVGFLLLLGTGIATAIGVGSAFIPTLMEDYPAPMRAFFFGLILASVAVPFKMITMDSKRAVTLALCAGAVGLVVGFLLTDPSHRFESTQTWVELESEGESLKELVRRGPSAVTTETVFWADQNAPLRLALREHDPQGYAALKSLHNAAGPQGADKKTIKARSKPYHDIQVPPGVPAKVPQPSPWFMFFAGMIAICAMILPGISGSYLLLIMNAYFFLLNALKGLVTTLLTGTLPWTHLLYVSVFSTGAAIGLLSFARVLSYLLDRHSVVTLGVLVGLMVGCLRGIWPFRDSVDGVASNVLPSVMDVSVGTSIAAGIAGVVIVTLFTRWGSRAETTA
jgi:putative membrane protein